MRGKSLLVIALFLSAMLWIAMGTSAIAQSCGNCDREDEYRRDACTVVIVGKAASADGSVISTHTCDCGVCDWTWRYVPPKDHAPGTMRKIYWFNQFETKPPEKGLRWDAIEGNFNGLEIPEVPHTFGYLHGAFGYMNDNQVAIGESTIGNRKEMDNETSAPKMDITALTMLAMERARTAREAIQIMGDLAVKYGYGHTDNGEMLAVTDPNEAWIFEIFPVGPLWVPDSDMPGAVWCAQRVPDDHVSICPNESRIGEIDLSNKNYFMASENAISFAIENGFYDPNSGKPFNWKRAYSPSEFSASSTNGARGRMWRFFDLVAPSKKFSPDTPNMDFPFSIKPEKKYSVYDVMLMLRDKFDGTQFWTARGIQGGPFQNPNYLPYGFKLDDQKYDTPRCIGVNRAEYVVITQCRSWLPNPIGGLLWIGWGAQDTHCMMPFYQGVTELPKSFQIGDHWQFDRNSARWAFDYVDFHTQVVYSYAIQDVRKAQEKWEKPAVDRTPEIDQKALALYKQSPELARKFLTEYCINNANLVINAWWELGDQLLVKYNKLWIYDVQERKRRPLLFPDWWLRELVKYNGLTPSPQKNE
ncbi:MAG: C69 family dipeptidase [candidate division KSB1 bacterium]|nr:C69 family dipeptidase [candidate division KSB1 bacterium]MDZ7336402.1 C69 family dipeptidase [candidate division KSB1 bacterium]MDZ7358495.1 C69 family dipeptidase [candidate division KSB1 bacterium]MDZ7376335.1 C69 family dipeptidase [candidate division KSB1 bacterium]MDZ7401475.1 C69 family dipeptidase [candidate division KSB1 bacterium]